MNQPKIAVLCGGDSPEAEVSRSSGKGIADALAKSFDSVSLIELGPDKDLPGIGGRLKDSGIEVVFPALHGGNGEDGTLQRLLDNAGIAYVGSGPEASARGMDKNEAKKAFRKASLPVARDWVVEWNANQPEKLQDIINYLGGSVVVKPLSQGSALGVSFCRTVPELESAVLNALKLGPKVLVEECIQGREVTAALLERNGLEVFPLVEILTPKGTWYDYEHRYQPGLSTHFIPAPLTPQQTKRVSGVSSGAFIALGCRDLARADLIVPKEGDPILLEVNTLPGFTPTSLYPDAARAGGLSFEELTAYLVNRALQRK